MNLAFSRIRLRSFFGWMILGAFIVYLPLEIIGAENGVFQFVSDTLVFFAFPLLWLFYKMKKHNAVFTSFFDKPSSIPWRLILIATAMGMIFSFGVSFIQFYILAQMIPDFLVDLLSDGNVIDMSTTFTKILSVISACIFAPIMEEVIFRGFFLNRMAYKWGVKRAIIISSLIFGFGHVDVVGAFLFGVVMCLLYIKTKSLWTNIIVHALNNTVVSIIQFTDSSAQEPVKIADLQALSNLWMGLVIIIISLLWLVPFIRRNWRTVREVGLPLLRIIQEEKQADLIVEQAAYSQVVFTERYMAVELPDEAVNHLGLEESDYVKVELVNDTIVIKKADERERLS
ncbi:MULTISPECIES: type II CAAX endopeptidase family protein [unclassified Bacillus (in: firmicutes)]|uniref:type II CAAX endopeptidase family protein n=1 Tax=unclassified Bacillus (in: firmicutes) TaxID=185979 RepID=UPI00232F09C1|nr:type II CAAX endopeptidase family protein [Bacillus sp. BP-3]MDC2866081.1 type II CAAX endopeptidase family protein [Bacillus sp. BP-3]